MDLHEQSQIDEQSARKTLTVEQRRVILGWAISQRVRIGYRLISRTDTTAQMTRPKSFNTAFAVLSLILVVLFGIGLILLLIYFVIYLGQKEKSVYFEVDPFGGLKTIES